MSQLSMIKPSSSVPNLPRIPHPLSGLGTPEKLGVRGLSRVGSRSLDPSGGQRPLSQEPKSARASRQGSRLQLRGEPEPGSLFTAIPEGVEIVQGDPDKTRLPIFGNRSALGSRQESRLSCRLPSRSQAEIDELELALREKVKTGFFETRTRFKHADPDGKGVVSWEALGHIVATLLPGKQISHAVFSKLMERIGLNQKPLVRFEEFYARFRDLPTNGDVTMRSESGSRKRDRQFLTANQAYALLKERIKQRTIDPAGLINCGSGASQRVSKFDLRSNLVGLGFSLEDNEYDKFWNKFDCDGLGSVESARLLMKLGVSLHDDSTRSDPGVERSSDDPSFSASQFEAWLANRLRIGFTAIKSEFEQADTAKTGMVYYEVFLQVMDKFGFSIKVEELGKFLQRCNVRVTKERQVDYRQFLIHFQDRSEEGMPHKILTDAQKKQNPAKRGIEDGAATDTMERQVLDLFQKDFLQLLEALKECDPHETSTVVASDFRIVLERQLGLKLSDDQFDELLEWLPMDKHRKIKYTQLLAQFDTRSLSRLFEEKPKAHHAEQESPTVNSTEKAATQEEELALEKLKQTIRYLVRHRYPDVEKAFYELDEINSNQLTQETMYQLLKKLEVDVHRGDIRRLFASMILTQKGNLDFLQFARHFGYSKSASFPNAKVVPPRKGDADMMQRSRHLNADHTILHDGLRVKIGVMWDELRSAFVELDPFETSSVSRDEFKDILTELCIELNDYELEALCKKFQAAEDGRINYVEFLRPHKRYRRRAQGPIDGSQPDAPGKQATQAQIQQSMSGLDGITDRLRSKLTSDWTDLRRAFKKLDSLKEGHLTVPEFKSVLKLCNIVLDEEEMFHVMSEFDKEMTGKISYHRFLNDVQPASPKKRAKEIK